MSRSSKSGSRFCRPRAMLLVSSRISMKNETVCANTFEAKNEPACGELRHEVEAFILTAIRAGVRKRRRKEPHSAPDSKCFTVIGLREFSGRGLSRLAGERKP